MDYNKLKEILENLIKVDFVDEYLKSFSNNIKTINNFHELEQSILLFILIEREYKKHTEEKYSKDYSDLIHEIQIKYTQLANNITGDLKLLREVIYLHEIISQIPNIKPWKEFIDIVEQIKSQYRQLSYSSDIQVFVNDMLMLGEILIQDKNYLKNHLQRIFVLNIHTMTNFEYNTFLKQLFKYYNVELNFILECLNELFDEDKYFSLRSIERRSIFNWSLHFISNIPEYHNHSDWSILYPKLKNLLFIHLKQDQKDEAMYLEFFIWHVMGNLFQTLDEMKKFNEEITYPASLYYKDYNLLKCRKTQNKKIKIALVKDRIANTSVTKVELSLFRNLLNNKEFLDSYEISVYSCDYFEKSQDDPAVIKLFEELGIKVYNPNGDILKTFGFYGDHHKKAIKLRESIMVNNTDIMIIGTNNFPLVNFLFVNRTVQKQIYWSHGNYEYHVDNIDFKISHGGKKIKKVLYNDYVFYEFNIPMIEQESYKYDFEVNEIKKKFETNVVILGTIGRLIKIDNDEYLKMVISLMEKYPYTLYFACGNGNNDSVLSKIRRINPNMLSRFIFTGHINASLYGELIDVWLDTFPYKQGNSSREFVLKNKAIVSLFSGDSKEYNESFKIYNSVLEEFGYEKLFPIFNHQRYVKLSSLFIEDKVFRDCFYKEYSNEVLRINREDNFFNLLEKINEM